MPPTMWGWWSALALLVATFSLGAAAQEASAPETVEQFMERYERALDRGDPALLRDVYAEWSPERESSLSHYFRDVIAEQNVEFSEVIVDQNGGDRAHVRFVRRDRFTDVKTGDRVLKKIQLEKALLLRDGYWRVTRAD